MKNFYIIIISTALACVLGTWMLISYDYLEPQFEIVKDVLGVFQIVLSIFIAYLLYDRFGTSKKLLEKQNELIIEFLEELKKVRLYIHGKTEEGRKSIIHLGIGKNLQYAKSITVSKKKVLFNSIQFYTELSAINLIIEHPLFPSDLKEEADIFRFGMMTNILDDSIENYALISFSNEEPKDQEKWMYPNDGDMTVEEYLEKIENSVEKLEKWINKESSIKIKLNLN